jgi:hypothetical protein
VQLQRGGISNRQDMKYATALFLLIQALLLALVGAEILPDGETFWKSYFLLILLHGIIVHLSNFRLSLIVLILGIAFFTPIISALSGVYPSMFFFPVALFSLLSFALGLGVGFILILALRAFRLI